MKRILFVTSDLGFLVNHRGDLLRALSASQKFSLKVLLLSNQHPEASIPSLDVIQAPLTPLSLFHIYKIFYQISRNEKIDILHSFSLKTNFISQVFSILVNFRGTKVFSFTGMGSAFIAGTNSISILRVKFFEYLTKILFNTSKTVLHVQNNDDEIYFNSTRNPKFRVLKVKGTFVDQEKFKEKSNQHPRKSEKVSITFASRLIADKGLWDFIDIIESIPLCSSKISVTIAGAFSPSNPSRVKPDKLIEAMKNSGINFLGPVRNMPSLL